MEAKLKPLPSHVGIGIMTNSPVALPGYTYQPVGNFHNYLVATTWKWPVTYIWEPKTIDGFSPNLNKELHAGHLKNLAVGNALANILGGEPVAMLGAALGVNDGALDTYKAWCKLAGYNPKIYFDNELPKPTTALQPGHDKYEGCLLFNNVVVYRADGRPTYAAHDLAFMEIAQPDFYLTGAEQKDHFKSLSLGDKHLPLGLLLGADGRKMRSSVKKEDEEANALSAQELFTLMLECLNAGTKDPKLLAWNILAFQFNSSLVAAPTKFNAQQWAKPEAPGVYLTYTVARISKALNKANPCQDIDPTTKEEIELSAFSEYFHFYLAEARQRKEPSIIAGFALNLAKKLSSSYASTPIANGSDSWISTITRANTTLKACMGLLGMYILEEV